jgi:UDP-N-acetylmuramoylalanine--D-glutamate ligase
MNVKGKKVVIVGLAVSGVAAANRLQQMGARVFVTDSKGREELAAAIGQLAPGIQVETGGHSAETFADAALIVVSPGVPLAIRPLREARQRGAHVIAEVELGYHLCPGSYIAVTGTNGKSTTTALIGEMLRHAGQDAAVCGNIGMPLTALVTDDPAERTFVLEMSSFQLEGIEHFRAHVAVLLNISPDHLDRYTGIEAYARAKARIFMNQTRDDFAVVNRDDPWCTVLTKDLRARDVPISLLRKVDGGVYLAGDRIVSTLRGRADELVAVQEMGIQGVHNIENAMAAAAAALVSGSGLDAVRSALREFRGLPHRMESVGEVKGVRFINDSKGTNIGAVIRSLQSLDKPIHLIAGGRSKGTGYHPLRELVVERVKTLVLIGDAAPEMEEDLRGTTEIRRSDTLEEAVQTAYAQAGRGEFVLLSPGCASFDMFENFEERGRCFADAVRRLQADET